MILPNEITWLEKKSVLETCSTFIFSRWVEDYDLSKEGLNENKRIKRYWGGRNQN